MKLVYVGIDRHLHLLEGDPAAPAATSLTAPPPFTVGQPDADAWSWPTFSPDGAWIAAIAVSARDDESGPARVVTTSTDGLRQTEWAELPDAVPLYVQWHPSGQALCVLSQVDEDLRLSVVHADRLGAVRDVAQGVPLFFNWTPDGDRVWVHHGVRRGSRATVALLVRDPLGAAEDELYPKTPGSFCAPVFVAGQPVVAVRAPEGMSAVVAVQSEADTLPLVERAGLLALVAGPGGLLGVTASEGGEGAAYTGVDVLDLRAAEPAPVRVTDGKLLAFVWTPDAAALIVFRVDTEGNCMSALHVDRATGVESLLGTFWPTRDLFFYLHFFDQFVQSHPLVSPDGRWLTWAGYPAGGGQADLSEPPRVWVRSLTDLAARPIEVGRGSFSTFAAAVS